MSKKAMKLNEIMEQAQVFASAWSIVGGRFDGGNAMDDAELAKSELHQMVAEALAEQPAQQRTEELLEIFKDVDQCGPLLGMGQPAQPSKPCEWQREDDIHMPDTWRSDCGVMWTFTDGGPVENDMKHCCGCGAKLREKNT